jgi:hypothetical protein
MDGESSLISRQWVTADARLCEKECELLYAYLVPSAAGADVSLYDGENATGDLIAPLKEAAVSGHEFRPPAPILCRKGLYVDVGSNVTGVLVMWRVL